MPDKEALNVFQAHPEILSLLFKNSSDILFIKDEEFKIVAANESLFRLYPKDQHDKIIGFTTAENFIPQEREAFLMKDKEAFENGSSETIESILCPDGQRRWLHTTKTRFFVKNNKPYIFGVARDFTDLKKQEKYHSLLYRIAADPKTNYLTRIELTLEVAREFGDFSCATLSLFSKTGNYVLVSTHQTFASPSEVCPSGAIQEASDKTSINELGEFSPPLEISLKNSKRNPLEISRFESAEVIIAGEQVGAINFFNGQSSGRGKQQVTRLMLKTVAQFVGHHLLQHQQLQEKEDLINTLEQSNSELQKTIYHISHDVRGPCLSVRNLLEFVAEDIEAKDYSSALSLIEKAKGTLNRTAELTSDIISLTQIEHQEIEKEKVNIEQMINEIVDDLRFLNITQSIEFYVDTSVDSIFTQKRNLHTVVFNLVSNAIKYSASDTDRKPFVKICAFLENSVLTITVEDNGVGVPLDKRDKLFGMFQRFHTSKIPSSGLGLHITQKSAQAMGGAVFYEPRNEGSLFRLAIPDF